VRSVGDLVNDSDLEAFRRDGAVCVRALFDRDEIDRITAIVGEMLDHPSPRAKTASRPGEPAFFEDFCNWPDHPALLELLRTSSIAPVAAALMGSETVRLYHDHVLSKEPGAQQRTPWHQDQPYYNIDGRQNVSAWIPIDPVERATTLEFVAGSHGGTWYLPTSFLAEEAHWFPAGSLQPVPDIDAHRDRYQVLGWELRPGDAVFFHMLTLHAAAGNSRTTPRRVLSLRFLGDDITHAPRPWVTSPEFAGLDEQLPAGAPMHHELFPPLPARSA
jgi:ectoine hydroxylase-related dioxygenase (phytanoyl-CoA dioxygenase family)